MTISKNSKAKKRLTGQTDKVNYNNGYRIRGYIDMGFFFVDLGC